MSHYLFNWFANWSSSFVVVVMASAAAIILLAVDHSRIS